jgi:hypothetical protein
MLSEMSYQQAGIDLGPIPKAMKTGKLDICFNPFAVFTFLHSFDGHGDGRTARSASERPWTPQHHRPVAMIFEVRFRLR